MLQEKRSAKPGKKMSSITFKSEKKRERQGHPDPGGFRPVRGGRWSQKNGDKGYGERRGRRKRRGGVAIRLEEKREEQRQSVVVARLEFENLKK